MADDKRQRCAEALLAFVRVYREEPEGAGLEALSFIDAMTELLAERLAPPRAMEEDEDGDTVVSALKMIANSVERIAENLDPVETKNGKFTIADSLDNIVDALVDR